MLTSCSCLPILPKSQLSAQNHEISTPTLIPIHLQSIQQSSIHAQVSYASAPRTIHPPLCQFITHPSRLHLPMPQVSYASATRKVHPPLNTRSSKTHPIIIHLWHLYSWWWRIAGPNTNKQTNKQDSTLAGRARINNSTSENFNKHVSKPCMMWTTDRSIFEEMFLRDRKQGISVLECRTVMSVRIYAMLSGKGRAKSWP